MQAKLKQLQLKKKGLSQVIAIAGILLITLLALAIVMQFLTKIISQPLLSPQSSCLEAGITPPLKIEKACYDESTKDIELTLKREINSKLGSFEAKIIFPEKTEQWSCGTCGSCSLLKEGETKTYKINSEKPEKLLLLTQGCKLEEKEIKECK